MIVYSGKQRGNDFNNGDEALFQDASRPRDNDKFKIKPGLQSDKWDWRQSNKNTTLSQMIIKGGSTVPGTPSGSGLKWAIPVLRKSWTATQLADIGFSGATQDIIDGLEEDKANNPYVALKEGSMVYETGGSVVKTNGQRLEVVKSGLYIVQATGQFIFPAGYDSNTSYQYKYWVGVAAEVDGVFVPVSFQGQRCCGNGDAQTCFHIAWIEEGTRLTSMVAHSYTSGTTFVFQNLNFIRLG